MGSVHAVWAKDGEQKIRVKIGESQDGEPILTPWLHTSDHRGDLSEEQRYAVGQNVLVASVSGDMRQATISPYAETKEKNRPVHGSDKAKTAQFDRTRRAQSGVHYDFWLADDKKEADPDKAIGLVRFGQAPQQKHEFKKEEGQDEEQEQDEVKGVALLKFKESITLQVGDNTFVKITDGKVDVYVGDSHATVTENSARLNKGGSVVIATSQGCKMKKGGDFVAVVDGQVLVSQEPIVGADPLLDE
jgi:hypothetical protein